MEVALNNPNDLIREADEALAALAIYDGFAVIDLVRRLRDALRMSERAVANKRDQIEVMTVVGERIARERDEARAALAEANTTIQRVRALAEKYDDQCGPCGSISGGRSIAEDIRRALKGEP